MPVNLYLIHIQFTCLDHSQKFYHTKLLFLPTSFVTKITWTYLTSKLKENKSCMPALFSVLIALKICLFYLKTPNLLLGSLTFMNNFQGSSGFKYWNWFIQLRSERTLKLNNLLLSSLIFLNNFHGNFCLV